MKNRKQKIKTPLKVEQIHEKSTGWRGVSILDAEGYAICNMVGQLDDSEVKIARAICAAVNKAYPPPKPKFERIPF